MNDHNYSFSPKTYAALYRIIGIILLCLLWMISHSSITGLFFLLLISILHLLRWRFSNLRWTLILEQALCIFAARLWANADYGLVLSTFDSILLNFPLAALPSLVYSFFYKKDYFLGILLLKSIFSAIILWNWQNQRNAVHIQMDMGSKKLYELESLKNELLVANVQVAKMSEISERSRIAREIHDNAGHEIIAAYMSLQVVEELLAIKEPQVKAMFKESIERLEKGIGNIREAVHNLAPLTSIGIDSLKKLCDEFTMCPIDLKIYGDTSKVPVYLWSILEPCLKEALTNIFRHAKAENISVTLDVTPFIVRLSVENDGVKDINKTNGIGLRNLQQRANAIGGNVSIDTSENFRLICILPIE